MSADPQRPPASPEGAEEVVEQTTEPTPEAEARDRAEGKKMLKEAGSYGAIGLEFGISVVIGYFIGNWLDQRLGTVPWLTLVFIGFGVASAARSLVRAARRAKRQLSQGDEE